MGLSPKRKVRAGETSRLLGVVSEVSLAIFIGVVTDNLNRVLVGTDSTVGTKTEELSLIGALVAESNLSLHQSDM